MNRFFKRYGLWVFYLVFLIIAALYGGREPFLTTESRYVAGKLVLLAMFFGFLAYSFYATLKESFFKTVRIVNSHWWGLQIGLDLYISVFLSLALVYLVEGSIVITLLWAIPIIIFANLAILPYLLLNYGTVVGLLLP